MRECKAAVDEPVEDERVSLRNDPDREGGTMARGKDQRWHEHHERRTYDDRLNEAALLRGEGGED